MRTRLQRRKEVPIPTPRMPNHRAAQPGDARAQRPHSTCRSLVSHTQGSEGVHVPFARGRRIAAFHRQVQEVDFRAGIASTRALFLSWINIHLIVFWFRERGLRLSSRACFLRNSARMLLVRRHIHIHALSTISPATSRQSISPATSSRNCTS